LAKEFLSIDGLALYDSLIKEFFNSQLFVGTQAEYDAANAIGKIPVNALVVITDDELGGATTAMLGKAVLGKMVLGQIQYTN
jgi:hypothetical protein